MKKLFLSLLAAATLTAAMIACTKDSPVVKNDNVTLEQKAAATTKCNANCLFTSCSITCSFKHGGAACSCAYGFATCACGGSYAKSAVNKEEVDLFVEVLQELSSPRGDRTIVSINRFVELSEQENGSLNSLNGALKSYEASLKALNAKEKAKVNEYFGSRDSDIYIP